MSAWGHEGLAPTQDEAAFVGQLLAARFPDADTSARPAVPWQSVRPPEPRLAIPGSLLPICDTSARERLRHARGRSYLDVVALQHGSYGNVPDAVARPRSAADVAAVLEWAAASNAAVVPFGGGTSVVGGVTTNDLPGPVVTLDMTAMAAVLDVDSTSLAAHIQAGARGPEIADQLRPAGLTLRFFPQSYEMSTLGGWLATRAAGHFATGPTHIDDLVQSISAVTPAGTFQSQRLPASGAGPSPDRLLLGSEGALAVITDAWVRVQRPPQHRASATVHFPDLLAAGRGLRAVVQAGLRPANCRVLDATEALLAGAGDGSAALLLLAFESPGAPVAADLEAALGLCRDEGGRSAGVAAHGGTASSADSEADRWRATFLRAPYLRDALVSRGVLSETFETATTWDRFDDLVTTVLTATATAVSDVCGDGVVTCRITHAYPDGAAPYFTVIAPAARGSEASQWQQIKVAASEALAAAGGTITHHHAVGRDHRPWYDRQRPDAFAAALNAAKAVLDPAGILNPGVLVD